MSNFESLFINFLRCEKQANFAKKNDERIYSDENFMIENHQMKSILKYSKEMYSDIAKQIDVSDLKQAHIDTLLLIQNNQSIINPVFFYKDLYFVFDYLIHNGFKYDLIKAQNNKSSDIKMYLDDVASFDEEKLKEINFQSFILNHYGINHDNYFLALNTSYVRAEELEHSKLFNKMFVSSKLSPLLEDKKTEWISEIETFFDKYHQDSFNTSVRIGAHCKNPYDCPFKHVCWKGIEKNSIHNIPRISEAKKTSLLAKGWDTIEKIEDLSELTDIQKSTVKSVLANKILKQPMKLMMFLNRFQYPLYFLDFEAIIPSVPLYEKSRAYDVVPTQYSLHIQENKTAEYTHKEFIQKDLKDPRFNLMINMLNELGDRGSIIVYNKNFESSVIDYLARTFPDYAGPLSKLQARLVDLMAPFKEGMYFDPKMYFSYSLKAVLPALVPDLTYKGLFIKNGADAMNRYFEMLDDPESPQNDEIMKHLMIYCTLDTWAMVKILEVLRRP